MHHPPQTCPAKFTYVLCYFLCCLAKKVFHGTLTWKQQTHYLKQKFSGAMTPINRRCVMFINLWISSSLLILFIMCGPWVALVRAHIAFFFFICFFVAKTAQRLLLRSRQNFHTMFPLCVSSESPHLVTLTSPSAPWWSFWFFQRQIFSLQYSKDHYLHRLQILS